MAHQTLWRPRPFTHHHLPWEPEHAELATWLRSRSLADAEAAHNHPQRLRAPAPFAQLAAQSIALSEIGDLPSTAPGQWPSRLGTDVPGRKWQQIKAFADALNFRRTPEHWLDWCAGKGHLGRHLAHSGQALTCLEHDPLLVDAGNQLSRRLGIDAEHRQQNVLAADAADHVYPRHTPVALHACGDLHMQLMRIAADAGCRQLAIAPCCYNRINAPEYQAVSAQGKASTLRLSLEDLNLPLSETVTAGARVRRQRDTSMARRLAFDLLQRKLRGIDDYLSTPSLPVAWLDKPFADYCRELAALRHLPAVGQQDWVALETAGWQRLGNVRNLELVRGLFRRPLELWLVLDRAGYLQDRDYAVQLGTFCETRITPRNLMLLAERH
ncbi:MULTISPECIES: methyltransferase [unclassified Pseudomonas]|uniref:methyltransferase n=1 Tax=unclassified Pseudomonas TaxID=196821 RepID=UPI00387E78D8